MLWGKWGGVDATDPYPLEAHLIDTAAFAMVLCERWVPERLIDTAGRLLGAGRDGAVRLVVSAAGLHDLGKASAVFQRQLLARRVPAGMGRHAAWLDAAGLVAPALPLARLADAEQRWVRRHEVAGAVMLHGGLDGAGARGVGSLVSGHHGLWEIPETDPADPFATVCRYYRWVLEDAAWSAERGRIVKTVVEVTGADPGLVVSDAAVVPLLTGLVVLADWLASDLADRDRSIEGGWEAHYQRRLLHAEEAVEELLGTAARPPGTFTDVFSFAPARPVQRHLVREGGPGLRIVAVPTGEGKTEAALGHWLLNASERQGIFFALPTMATADAMFARVQQMFVGTAAFGALAHSRSLLNQFYADMQRPVVGETHDGCGGLTPSRWLHGSRRSVLAPVAVGTADQLILAAVRHRFNFLRMLGAATKTVVFDEVHSYDPYMAALLERFLVWAGEWHIDTVLLSATLPAERVEAYTTAYGGQVTTAVVYPSVITVGVDGATRVDALDASDAARTLRLEHHVHTDVQTGIIELVRVLRQRSPDAKIGVIVNTVGRCQKVAEALAGRTGDPALAGDLHVMHSRFTADVRARQVSDAVTAYGTRSVDGPATLVATQVVEQSMDLDFDVLVTELCPAPSLVQRAGRLHRHRLKLPGRARSRPDGCERPVVHVVAPADVHVRPVKELWPWLPYPPASMLRTWERGLDSGARTLLRVPGDVQAMVDASHVRLDELAADQPLARDLEHELYGQVVKRHSAERQAVPSPTKLRRAPARGLSDYASALDEERPQTRWIDLPSFDVLLVNGGPDSWQDDLPAHPTHQQIRGLLGCVVTVNVDVSQTTDKLGSRPDGWERTVLADVQIVDLQRHPRARLDALLGFLMRKDADG
jgi:CRISPR-associated endonuclease/helicase Cas3